MKAMAKELAVKMGYSADRRKRKRQHRKAARNLLRGGTLLNAVVPAGSIPLCVAKWHLEQARAV